MNKYEKNYKLLKDLLENHGGIENLEVGFHTKLKVEGFMPLCIEKIADDVISLAHYYVQNSDLMADPEMEIRIFPELNMVEALTFYNAGLGIYQRVYLDENRYYPRLKKELNSFLTMWLQNLKDQGFYEIREENATC